MSFCAASCFLKAFPAHQVYPPRPSSTWPYRRGSLCYLAPRNHVNVAQCLEGYLGDGHLILEPYPKTQASWIPVVFFLDNHHDCLFYNGRVYVYFLPAMAHDHTLSSMSCRIYACADAVACGGRATECRIAWASVPYALSQMSLHLCAPHLDLYIYIYMNNVHASYCCWVEGDIRTITETKR